MLESPTASTSIICSDDCCQPVCCQLVLLQLVTLQARISTKHWKTWDPNETAQLANNFSRMSTNCVQPPVSNTTNQLSAGLTSTAMAAGTTTTFSNAPFANQNNQFYSRKSRVDPTPFQLMDTTKSQLEVNQVDSWIDYLDSSKLPCNTVEVKMEDSILLHGSSNKGFQGLRYHGSMDHRNSMSNLQQASKILCTNKTTCQHSKNLFIFTKLSKGKSSDRYNDTKTIMKAMSWPSKESNICLGHDHA